MSHNDNYWRIDVGIGREPSGESPLSITHKKRLQKQSLNGGSEGARTLDLLRDRQTL